MLHLFQFKDVTGAKNSVWEASQAKLQVHAHCSLLAVR
jgi:hypothetical protein